MRQVVFHLPHGERVLMWEDGQILIEHNEERSFDTTPQELSYIVQEFQKSFGPFVEKELEE